MDGKFEKVTSEGSFEFLNAAVTHGRGVLAARLAGRPGPNEQSFKVSAVIGGEQEDFPVRVSCAITGLGGPRKIIFREYLPGGPRDHLRYVVVNITPEGVEEVEGVYNGPGETVFDVTIPSSGENTEQ